MKNLLINIDSPYAQCQVNKDRSVVLCFGFGVIKSSNPSNSLVKILKNVAPGNYPIFDIRKYIKTKFLLTPLQTPVNIGQTPPGSIDVGNIFKKQVISALKQCRAVQNIKFPTAFFQFNERRIRLTAKDEDNLAHVEIPGNFNEITAFSSFSISLLLKILQSFKKEICLSMFAMPGYKHLKILRIKDSFTECDLMPCSYQNR